jgi:hypothetical protein
MTDDVTDPTRHWDGSRWLKWDGQEWKPEDSTPAAADDESLTFSSAGAAQAQAEQPAAKRGLFKSKTEEEKAAKAEARAAAVQASSPAGLARAAREAGRTYFQFVRDVATTKVSAGMTGNAARTGHQDHTGTLESIEAQGWSLFDVGYVFQETSSDSKSKMLGSGERTAVAGKIVGVYLFRASEPS